MNIILSGSRHVKNIPDPYFFINDNVTENKMLMAQNVSRESLAINLLTNWEYNGINSTNAIQMDRKPNFSLYKYTSKDKITNMTPSLFTNNALLIYKINPTEKVFTALLSPI